MNEATRTWRWMLLSLLAALGGCAELRDGPDPIIAMRDASQRAVMNGIAESLTGDCAGVSPPADGSETPKERRNRLAAVYMFAVDAAYSDYERTLLSSTRVDNLGAASALLATGDIAGDQNLARSLTTTNAIVTGTYGAIDRDYLFNQTLIVLRMQMRASRAVQRALLFRRLSLPYADWNSCMALPDLLAYEQAGTFNAALAALSASTARAQQSAEATLADSVAPEPTAVTRPPDFRQLSTFAQLERRPTAEDTRRNVRIGTFPNAPNPGWRTYWFVEERVRLDGAVSHFFADSETCPAALQALHRLEALDMPRPDVPNLGRDHDQSVVDGVGYTLAGASRHADGQPGEYSIESNSGSPLSSWAEAMLGALQPCWTSLNASPQQAGFAR